jgi:hypothetical protein
MNSFTQPDGKLGWRDVQITDLEDAVVLPPNAEGLGKRLSANTAWRPNAEGLGKRVSGNKFWRSPEAWARGLEGTPSDIYSFAILVSL